MSDSGVVYRFFHRIEIRYADIDAQRHVNSARYFTFMEQARAAYMQNLGLWHGDDFDAIGIILAQQSCNYREAIRYGSQIAVGVATEKIGGKSIRMVYSIQDAVDRREMAAAESLLVAFDYLSGRSIPVPPAWRERIESFEASGI
jgi:acyl-CoA thioester hydrolase